MGRLSQLWAKALNPNETSVSYGRLMALVSLMFVLGWDTGNLVFAWKFNHHLPPSMAPLSLLPDGMTMGAQGAFVTLFYGITKYGDIKTAGVPPVGGTP